MKEHFQPEAGNEILKEFLLKLTPMGIVIPLREIYLYQGFRELVWEGETKADKSGNRKGAVAPQPTQYIFWA